MATGRLTLKPFAIVTEVLYDRDRKRATGVRVLDAVTDQTTDYSARVVFLCASTLNSTWLLLRSATDVWPGGLGSSSGELGHNLMDHHFRVGAQGRLEGLDDKRSEEHTSELQSPCNLVCRLLLEKKKKSCHRCGPCRQFGPARRTLMRPRRSLRSWQSALRARRRALDRPPAAHQLLLCERPRRP